MTRQEAFDLNWKHFVTEQHPKCTGPATPGAETNCLYADGQGNCCAVGLLLSPESRQALRGIVVPIDELQSELDPADPDYRQVFKDLDYLDDTLSMDFLEALQGCHDNVVSDPTLIAASPVLLGPQPVQFARRLQDVAQRYDLVVPAAAQSV